VKSFYYFLNLLRLEEKEELKNTAQIKYCKDKVKSLNT